MLLEEIDWPRVVAVGDHVPLVRVEGLEGDAGIVLQSRWNHMGTNRDNWHWLQCVRPSQSSGTVLIQNSDGFWLLSPEKKIAVKCAFLEKSQKLVSQAASSIIGSIKPANGDSTFTLDENVQEGTQVYVVSQTLSEQGYAKVLASAQQILAAANPQNKIDLSDKIPF